MSLTNIDNLLQNLEVPANPEPVVPAEIPEPEAHTEQQDNIDNVSKKVDKVESETTQSPEPKDEKSAESTDDYGQPVSKKERVYTESEVQQMMRDRNSRGEFARQEAARQQQPTQPQQPQQSNETSEDWEAQLKTVIKQTVNELTQEQQQQQWQAQARQQQAEFEIKFNNGASKYQDFESVVVGKAITTDMVRATMGMDNPAAFLYAAAKTQANELDRIAKIGDPYVQAVELGKLDERMKRGKATVSSAPKPIESVKGDAINKSTKPKSIDDLLRAEDAKRLQGRR